MADPLVGAPRDASSYGRPNTRTAKVVHVGRVLSRHRTGQPLSGGRDVVVIAALCSGVMLDESMAFWSLEQVPDHVRCRRRACAAQWPACSGVPPEVSTDE